MGEEEESGGVRALRTWAGEAIARAKALLPEPGTVAENSRAHGASVGELEALSHLLDHDPELRGSVTLWLGGALTLRHGIGGGAPGDRERAHALLREVRDPATRTGATASVEDRRWAALFLLMQVMPFQDMPGGLAPQPDTTALFDRMMGEVTTLAAEVREWVADAAELPLPENLKDLPKLRDLWAHPTVDGIADLLTDLVPDDDGPYAAEWRSMINWLRSRVSGFNPPGAAPDSPGRADASAQDTPDVLPGGAVFRDPDLFRRLIAAKQAADTAIAALGGSLEGDGRCRQQTARTVARRVGRPAGERARRLAGPGHS
ncbi:hypothetical protein ABT354_27085 [Streptomyces sp. NPDC000594]|uniref:hypothetical protein n=1 Tax=Streptomyces sp. NPDC000594 TaxID=3154261 RepID=UPI00331D6322